MSNEVQLVDGPAFDDESFDDLEEGQVGVDKREDIELKPGTSSTNYTTLSILRMPSKMVAWVIVSCFNFNALLHYCQSASPRLAPYVQQAVQYMVRVNTLAKAKGKTLNSALMGYLPDSVQASLRRGKFASVTPLMPSGNTPAFFSEYFYIKYYEDRGELRTLEEETQTVWKYNKKFGTFLGKIKTKNGKKPTEAEIKAALAVYKKRVFGSAHVKHKRTPAAALASATAAKATTDADKDLAAAINASLHSDWRHKRDELEQQITMAKQIMDDPAKTPEMRKQAQTLFSHITLEVNEHMKREPQTSGLPAARNLEAAMNAAAAKTNPKKRSAAQEFEDLLQQQKKK